MDLSFWNQLNPNIVFEPTRKKFFDKYLCKMVINCPAGRLVNDNKDNIEWLLRQRMEYARSRNWGGSWASSNYGITGANADQIRNIRSIRYEYGDTIKIRIEEPRIQIYADDEFSLKLIALRIDPEFTSSITGIQAPENDEQLVLLNEGKIITKKATKIEYKYKVFLRDGDYDIDSKNSMFSYLMNLGDDVKISPSSIMKFNNTHKFLWGVVLYVNDPDILTFLSVIQPGIIGRIHELAKVAE